MNVLIAIDSFKGCLSSKELSDEINEAIKEVSSSFEVRKIAIADGGEGTKEALISQLNAKEVKLTVKNPIFENIEASYAILENHTALIEMASSSGLDLIPKDKQNPLKTSTFGLGQMIKDALDKSCNKFIIGIGGSATNDGGMGMLNALGFEFIDQNSNILAPCGESLSKVYRICSKNADERLKNCEFDIACDVDNPFYGKNGAAYVYAKQKGASESDIAFLDKGLEDFCELIKKDIKKDISKLSGAGAAGGLGGGFCAFLDAKLCSGTDIIFNLLGIETHISWADIIITGEGRLDFQTTMGKAPSAIAKLAKKQNKPVIALAGTFEDEAKKAHDCGVSAMFSIMDKPMTLEEAMDKNTAKKLIKKSSYEIFCLIKALKCL